MGYADGTTVAPEKTKAEIEAVVTKYGATHYGTANTPERSGITFVANGRMVRFALPMPSREETRAKLKRDTKRWRYYNVPDAVADEAVRAEVRRRWRCLLLAIKSKLEVVETGIETFEQAFLANIVTTDNMTVWERMKVEGSGVLLLEAAEGS